MIRYITTREGFKKCSKDAMYAEITKNKDGIWGLSYLDNWISKEDLTELLDTINKLNEN